MAFGWFLRAMLSQIVDPISDNASKSCPKLTPTAKFITIPKKSKDLSYEGFQMPLHYPRYKKADYEKMEEWRIDQLLRDYGLVVNGSLDEKREFTMGTFLWPDQM